MKKVSISIRMDSIEKLISNRKSAVFHFFKQAKTNIRPVEVSISVAPKLPSTLVKKVKISSDIKRRIMGAPKRAKKTNRQTFRI